MMKSIFNYGALSVGVMCLASPVMAEKPSFTQGIAATINPGLIDCGGRSRVSAVGEITSEDGLKWTVPANTEFETATKATDLYSPCGGELLGSVSELKLDDVPVVDLGGSEVITVYIFGVSASKSTSYHSRTS